MGILKNNSLYNILRLIGLLSLGGILYFRWSGNNNIQLLFTVIFFISISLSFFILYKNGYPLDPKNYEGNVVAKPLKFFGLIFIVLSSALLTFLILLWFDLIKIG